MQAFVKAWHDYVMVTKLMERVFEYLDRFYLKQGDKLSLGETAMRIFIDSCYKDQGVLMPLRRATLETFTSDR